MKKYLLFTFLSALFFSVEVSAQYTQKNKNSTEDLIVPLAYSWMIDGNKSSAILNLLDNFTPLTWIIGEPSGFVRFNIKNLSESHFNFSFPISKIKPGSGAKRRNEIKKLFASNKDIPTKKVQRFFDKFSRNNSEVSFRSTKIEPKQDGRGQTRYLTVTGDLTVGYKTISNVKIDAVVVGLDVNPEDNSGFVCSINFDFRFRLSDYGIIPSGSLERLSNEIDASVVLEIKRSIR